MIKKIFNVLTLLVLFQLSLKAQVTSTEVFETETGSSTSFTDNSQVFNITTQAQGPFDIQAAYPGTGWNGTAADNRYIDNDGFAVAGQGVGFTISSSGATPFTIKSLWMYLADNTANVNVTGTLTIVGKLGGVTKFTATKTSPFNNTSGGTNNGFTLIDFTTFGGSNNSNTNIDQLVFTTTNSFTYVGLDAFTWATIPALTATQGQTNLTCNGTCTGSATVTPSGGAGGYTYSWAPSGGSGASASSLCAGTYTCTITDAASTSIVKTFTVTQPSAITSNTTSITNVSCNGGSNGAATISASGGTGTLLYNWAPGNPTGDGTTSVSGLTAATWTCTITDANSCTKTQTAVVSQPSAITSNTTSITNVACNGGSNGAATISASGGTGALTYAWAPAPGAGQGTASISGLTAQVYTCTITDANSCTKTQTASISQPSAITSNTTSITNVSCNGGSNGAATISANGGTGSLLYNWAPGNPTGDGTTSVSGLTAGTWTCTITDANSCTKTQTAIVSQPSAITSNTTSITNVSCNGGSNGAATISASGGTGAFTYSWAPSPGTGQGTASISGLTAQIYTCTITDANSCIKTQTVSISQPTALGLTIASQTNVSVFGGNNGAASVNTATGGTGGYSYNWTPGNPTGDGTTSVTGLTAGTWSCTVTDANNCTTSQTFTITQPAAGAAAAINLDGSDDIIKSNSAINSILSSGNTITVEAWVNPANTTYLGCIVGNYQTLGSGMQFLLRRDFNNYVFWIDNGSGFTNVISSVSVATNTWTHLAGTWDGSVLSLYVNGVLSGTTAVSGSNFATSINDVWIGGNSAGTPEMFTGSIDEVRIWNRALCQGEIQNNMNGELKLPQSGLLSYYRFNQGLASANNSAVTTALDSSGNANNGILNNFTLNGNASNWIAPGGVTPGTLAPAFVSPTVTVSGNTSICTGATTTLTANGNVSSYSWIGGPGTPDYAVSPTSNASYSVTGTNSLGCISNMVVTTVTVNPTPTVCIGTNNPVCEGQQIDFNYCGGSVSSYTWSGPASFSSNSASPSITNALNNNAGTYSLSVTDANNCVGMNTTNITVNSLPTITASSSTLCAGDTYTFSPSGGVTYTYVPSGPVVTPGTTTNYTITGSDANNCVNTFTLDITVNQLPAIFAMANTQTICAGAGDTLTGTGGVSYVWSSNAGSATTTSVSINPTTTDTYTVTGTDVNGCINSNVVTVTVNTCGAGINNYSTNIAAIYPNPFSWAITVEVAESSAQLTIVNVVGQVAYNAELPAGKHTIDLSRLTNGVYYLQLKTGNNTTNRKLIKE